MLDYETLKLVWFILILVLFVGFAVTDGFDMGVGALLPILGKSDVERRVMINTVAPHWEGNQVWLVTGAGAVFAAWPMVYATMFSGFYTAMLITLFALFLRPMGFDYRGKIDCPKWRKSWDWALFVGSIIPPIIFGVAIGNLMQGVPFQFDEFFRSSYEGGILGLLNPFALMLGILSLLLFVNQGACWLQMKVDKAMEPNFRKASMVCSLAILVLFAAGGFWVSQLEGYVVLSGLDPAGISDPNLKQVGLKVGAWMDNYKNMPALYTVPALAFATIIATFVFSFMSKPALAFVSSSLILLLVIATAAINMFPFIMPSSLEISQSLTIWDATASKMTLGIMTIAAAIFVPIILCYTLWGYFKMFGRMTKNHITNNSKSVY